MNNSESKAVSINVLHPGAAPIAISLARLAGIRETVDQFTGWSPDSKSTSPGILVETLVSAVLCGCRPIYKVESFWENKAVEIFYPGENITATQLHDDAYARMLDKLAQTDCQRLFETVCLTMLQHHSLDIGLTHSDTTSVSVEGDYETTITEVGADQETFKIAYGHSKDHRPDLKQLKLGLSVQQDGLPLSGELLSGNKSDQVWNPEAVCGLSDLLEKSGYKNTIFLADCALISTSSLLRLANEDIHFISRLPETFGLAEALKEEAWNSKLWEDLGYLVEDPDAKSAYYKAWQTVREIEGKEFGFVVVHSSALEQRKEKTLLRGLERTEQELRKKSAELAKQEYACEPDARRAGVKLQEIVEKAGFDGCLYLRKETLSRYAKRGRPRQGEVPEIQEVWYAEVRITGPNEKILEDKKHRASTFVLVYRLPTALSAEEIVRNYKNQDKVEQGFKFLKQPLYLGAVYTKKPERVEALGYIFLLVLLLAKYLEHRVRISMARAGEALKVGGQKVQRPSAKTLLEILSLMTVLLIGGQLILPDNVHKDAASVIRWAGFEVQVYVSGKTPDLFAKNAPENFSTAK